MRTRQTSFSPQSSKSHPRSPASTAPTAKITRSCSTARLSSRRPASGDVCWTEVMMRPKSRGTRRLTSEPRTRNTVAVIMSPASGPVSVSSRFTDENRSGVFFLVSASSPLAPLDSAAASASSASALIRAYVPCAVDRALSISARMPGSRMHSSRPATAASANESSETDIASVARDGNNKAVPSASW
eukprot:Amastigsp_a676973_61.p3 type:complete len:187 gc:universal Amastigsp_a676973_61:950-390(-)